MLDAVSPNILLLYCYNLKHINVCSIDPPHLERGCLHGYILQTLYTETTTFTLYDVLS